MNCKNLGLGLGVLSATFALSGVGVSQAQIALQPGMSAFLPGSCPGGAANATVNLTALTGAGSTGESISPDGGYIGAGCKRYVVDVKLPANFNGYQAMIDGAIVETLDSQAECEATQLTVLHYRKAAGATAFTSAGGGTMRGNWVVSSGGFTQTGCVLAPTKSFATKGAAAPGDTMWRIAVGGVIKTLPVKVKVTAAMSQIPH